MNNFAKDKVSASLLEAVETVLTEKHTYEENINEVSDETKTKYADKARQDVASGKYDASPEKKQKHAVGAAKAKYSVWKNKQKATQSPVSGDRGYGKGRYMGDSVEVDGSIVEADKHSFIGKIQRGHELRKKVNQTWNDAAAAHQRGDDEEAHKSIGKHIKYANLEHPGTWRKSKDKISEASGTILGQNAEPDQSSTIDVNQKKKKKITELYKSTLHSYTGKAEKDSNKHEKDLDSGIRSGNADKANKAADKLNRRTAGLNRADDRLNKEEVVQEGALDDMKKAAYNAGHKHAMAGKDYDKADMKKEWGSHFKHFESGHMNGVLDRKTQKNEEVEQMDEVLDKSAKISDWIHDFVHSKSPKFAGKSKGQRRLQAIAAYYDKQRQNEETEQIDEISTETLDSYKKKAGLHASQLDKEGGKENTEKANKRFSGIIKATLKQFDKNKIRKEDKDPAMDAGVGSDGQFIQPENPTSNPVKKKSE